MSRVIGLYGGSGAGKSQVARWFAGHGALVIDADEVSREVSAPGGSAHADLQAAFPDCFLEDGTLDRRKLGARVFADETERLRLERTVHPHMRRRIKELIAQAGQDTVILDCAILLEPAFRDLADERWLVAAAPDVRLTRIMERDHLSREEAAARIAAQMPEAEMRRYADRVIRNDATPAQLADELSHVEAEIPKKA
ncbi:MAG: dephospho-CoA kinase [Clostridia bacterium]|nr:dephospho-CoA kinase [Clostridia bacterium]